MIPTIAYAASSNAVVYAQTLLAKFNDVILFPLISLMMGIAFLMFLYGAFEYVQNADSDAGRAQGQQHLLWGIVGLFIMVSAYGILSIAAGTFGLQGVLLENTTTGNPSTINPATNLPTGATVPTQPVNNTAPSVDSNAPATGAAPAIDGTQPNLPNQTGSSGSPTHTFSVMGKPTPADQVPDYAFVSPASVQQQTVDAAVQTFMTQNGYTSMVASYPLDAIPQAQRQDYIFNTAETQCVQKLNGTLQFVSDQAQSAGEWVCLK